MGHVDENAVVTLVVEESTELLPEEGTIIIQTAVEPAPQIGEGHIDHCKQIYGSCLISV